jgi:hypothetical protein
MEEIPGWWGAFALLSLERFAGLLGELGVPSEIAEAPGRATRCLQAALEREGLDPATDPDEAGARVDRALACVAEAYGTVTAERLRDWCLRFAVDGGRSHALLVWEQLLRRLCGLVSDDGSTVPSPFGPGANSEQCRRLAAYLDPGLARRTRERIDAAAGAPPSPWERRLNERTLRSAGEGGRVLTATEMAVAAAALIARRRRTRDALACLEPELSQDERDRLLEWAVVQSERLGIRVRPADLGSAFGER